jgi:hypothetical protein
VLLPIDSRYRRLDQVPASPLPAIGLALADLVGLPASLVDRVRSAVRRIELPTDEQSRPGWVSAATYGARRSIREFAAAGTRNFFEDADIERYSEILERHAFGAVGDFLHRHGFSTRELGQRAMSVINNFGGNAFVGSSVTGNSFSTANQFSKGSPAGGPIGARN